MLSIISSTITAILNYDKIDNNEDVVHDIDYCHQMIGIILADAIGTAIRAAVIIAPGEWGRAIYLLYAITKSWQQSFCL